MPCGLVLMLRDAVPPANTRSDRLCMVTPVWLGAVVGGTLSPAAPITTGARRTGRGRSVGGYVGEAARAVMVATTEVEVSRVSGVPGVPSVGVGPGVLVSVAVGSGVLLSVTIGLRSVVDAAVAVLNNGADGFVAAGPCAGPGVNVMATTLPAGMGEASGLVGTGVATLDCKGSVGTVGDVAHADKAMMHAARKLRR